MPDASRRPVDPAVQAKLAELLDLLDVNADRPHFADLLTSVAQMAVDRPVELDLKIASAALKEMREAFRTFTPYRAIPKVTIFGSARTKPDDPLYAQTRQVAAAMAAHGWMVVTGAGPGIMAAGMEGAGQAHSIGVSIRLPFEQASNPVIAHDPKLVSMKYFFTRKLMLVKESMGFISLPGGFGTLDETFELLTLTQTGKGAPVPIVFLDVPGGTYWQSAKAFIERELVTRRLVEPDDLALFKVTDRCEDAVAEIAGFYRNYDSLRYVGDTLVLRVRREPTDGQLAELDSEFADLCKRGRFEHTLPLAAEIEDGDRLHLSRIKFVSVKRSYSRLRQLIDKINSWVPA